jgi:hypothetical protein
MELGRSLWRSRSRAGMALAAAAGTVLLASAGYAAQPSDPRATFHDGNVVTCDQIGLPAEFQLSSPSNNNSSDTFLAGTVVPLTQGDALNVAITAAGTAADVVVDAVVVKGSNGYNEYSNPAVLPPALEPPQNYISPLTNGGNIPTISHWFVCYHFGTPPPPASLLVHKVVIPPAGTPVVPIPASYTIEEVCTSSGTHDVTFGTGGGTQMLTGLTPGETCTVTETSPTTFPPGTVVTGSPQTVTISGEAAVTATITNNFSAIAVETGTVQVVKAINGMATAPPASFTATLTCDRAPASTTLTLPGTGGSATPVTVTAGAECQVIESGLPAGWTVTYSVNGGTASSTPPFFVVTSDTTVTITVANTPPAPVTPSPTSTGLPVTGPPASQVAGLAGGLIATGSVLLLTLLVLRRRRARSCAEGQ